VVFDWYEWNLKGKGKGKISPRTGHEGSEGEYRYSSILSLTSALVVGGWSTSWPGRFTSRKETQYTLYRRLCGPQCRYGRVQKIPPTQGFDSRTLQPLASRCTDWAIHSNKFYRHFNIFPGHKTLQNTSLNFRSWKTWKIWRTSWPPVINKVVQIWPGLFVCKQVTVCPGHIWTTLYLYRVFGSKII
jgi:hypothetical protein